MLPLDTDRSTIRWYCPECKRVDPRHPISSDDEMPDFHNRPEHIGFARWSNDDPQYCRVKRIPQRYDSILNDWVLDTR